MKGVALKVLQRELGDEVSRGDILGLIAEMSAEDLRVITVLPHNFAREDRPDVTKESDDNNDSVSLYVSQGATWVVYQWDKYTRGNMDFQKLLRTYKRSMYRYQENGDLLLYYGQNARLLITEQGSQTFVPISLPKSQSTRLLKNIQQMLENFKKCKTL